MLIELNQVLAEFNADLADSDKLQPYLAEDLNKSPIGTPQEAVNADYACQYIAVSTSYTQKSWWQLSN